jgi:hypothetical protein
VYHQLKGGMMRSNKLNFHRVGGRVVIERDDDYFVKSDIVGLKISLGLIIALFAPLAIHAIGALFVE